MKVLIDTNVILDWLMAREPNSTDAKFIMEQCLFDEVDGYVASHSSSDLFFILRKDYSVEKRKKLLSLLCEGMNVVPEDKDMILSVLHREEWRDLEDGLQMQCAKNEEVDYIITQNLKDFRHSEIRAFSEKQFCEIIRCNKN